MGRNFWGGGTTGSGELGWGAVCGSVQKAICLCTGLAFVSSRGTQEEAGDGGWGTVIALFLAGSDSQYGVTSWWRPSWPWLPRKQSLRHTEPVFPFYRERITEGWSGGLGSVILQE